MKRFLSILIAFALLISLFTVAAVAFAEEPSGGEPSPAPETEREVGFDFAKFKGYVMDRMDDEGEADGQDFYLEMSRSFMFANKWWNDANKVHEIFPGINYTRLSAEDTTDKAKHKVTYVIDGSAEGERAPTVDENGYAETAHYKLGSAPKAAEGKFFNGWLVSYDGQPDWSTDIHYNAADVTVTATWVDSEDDVSLRPADDVIYLLYVSSSGSTTQDMKDWSRCLVTSTFSLTSSGPWSFRFAVVDGEKAGESGYSFDEKDMLATSFDAAQKVIDDANAASTAVNNDDVDAVDGTMTFRTKDTTAPQVDLSSTQKTKVTDGLTVGTTYSISTSLDITDASGTTVTYLVYKKVADGTEGATDGWLQIYDSNTRKVTEGYETSSDGTNAKGCISTSGVITPIDEDVTGENVYKIVYSVKDTYGNKGVKVTAAGETASTEEFHPEMLLKVNAAPVNGETATSIEAWKIVLYVIAGLSAVGIIVLLCVNPKPQTADARYNANAADNAQPADTETPAENSVEETAPTDDGDDSVK